MYGFVVVVGFEIDGEIEVGSGDVVGCVKLGDVGGWECVVELGFDDFGVVVGGGEWFVFVVNGDCGVVMEVFGDGVGDVVEEI